jgi:hypothetical protein
MVRRLVMLCAIITWVSARCCVAREVASSRDRVRIGRPIHCSICASGDVRAAGQPELVQEPRDEHRRERRVRRDEIVEHRAVRSLAIAPGSPALDRSAPPMRSAALRLVHPLHGAQRHAPHALDQREPEHGGHRPELAERKR